MGRESGTDGGADGGAAGGSGGGGQAALAVIVVAATALGALLLRTGGPVKGHGPLGRHSMLVLALVAGWAAAGIRLYKRYRDRPRDDHALGPVEERLADTVRYALMVLPVALPVLLLALHPFGGGGAPPPPPKHTPQPVDGQGFARQAQRHGDNHPVVGYVLLGLGIALALAVVGWAAVRLWRLRRPLSLPRRAGRATAADDEQLVLAQAVDSGRRALLDSDDARTAVIACYAAMEESLAASGVARDASDTPQDLLERAADGGLLTGAGAADLTALFREARYSSHPMDGTHRDRASAALTEIATQLEPRAAAPAEAAS